MKTTPDFLRKYLFCILCLCSAQVYSQSFESFVNVDYDMYIMFETFPYHTAILEFNNSKSHFTYRQKGESPTSKKQVN
ncbi:hypothetical protein FACS1894178_3770 [Bacteroidia bacterium]|nr:hypothetical protein FACS1894178_3770 [Bacteroidia bacterium]